MKATISFIAANPLDTTRLALDEEIRQIQQALRGSDLRDAFELRVRPAARAADLHQILLEDAPTIVHFSGHGAGATGIVLHSEHHQQLQLVEAAPLANMFAALSDNVRLVVLNACYSHVQAQAIVDHIDAVIGMNASVGDDAAKWFAASLYRALGFGRSVQTAFDLAVNAIALQGLPDSDVPILLVHPNVNVREIQVAGSPNTATLNPQADMFRVLAESCERSVAALEHLSRSLSNKTGAQFSVPIDSRKEVARLATILSRVVGFGCQQQYIPTMIRDYVNTPAPELWHVIRHDLAAVGWAVASLQAVLADYDGRFVVYRLERFRELTGDLQERLHITDQLLLHTDPPTEPAQLKLLDSIATSYERLIARRRTAEDSLASFAKTLDTDGSIQSTGDGAYRCSFDNGEDAILEYLNNSRHEVRSKARVAAEWYPLPYDVPFQCALPFASHALAKEVSQTGWPLTRFLKQLRRKLPAEQLPHFDVQGVWLTITFPSEVVEPLANLIRRTHRADE